MGEILHHLADAELQQSLRLRRMLVADNPPWGSWDGAAYAEALAYDVRPAADALTLVLSLRHVNVRMLASLSAPQWMRTTEHPEHGPIDVARVVELIVEHTKAHVLQARRARHRHDVTVSATVARTRRRRLRCSGPGSFMLPDMQQDEAEKVVAALRERKVFAHVYRGGRRLATACASSSVTAARRSGTSTAPPGLEAQVMRDGVLVGFVPKIPGSEGYTIEQTVDAIAAAVYD